MTPRKRTAVKACGNRRSFLKGNTLVCTLPSGHDYEHEDNNRCGIRWGRALPRRHGGGRKG